MSGSNQPACWQPFSSTAPFNFQLPGNPQLASNNGAVQQHMAQYGWHVQSPSGFQIGDGGTRPLYFASTSDPVMTINCTSAEGPGTCQGANGVNINGAQVHVPAGAQPGKNWDAHMTIVETATGQEYDLWHASISGSTITADTGAVANVNSDTGTRGGAVNAASFALAAGLLRPSELASGQINHALVIDVPCTNGHGSTAGFVWPATGGWGEYCGQYWNESTTGAPGVGQLFKLNMSDAQIAASGAPAWEQTIMTALAHYGAYAEDTNGSYQDEGIYIFMQDPISWTSLGQSDQWASVIRQLGGTNGTLSSSVPIPANQLEVVDPCVPQGTCPSSSTSTTTTTTTSTSTPVTTTTTSTSTPVTTTTATSTSTSSTSTATPSGHHHHRSAIATAAVVRRTMVHPASRRHVRRHVKNARHHRVVRHRVIRRGR